MTTTFKAQRVADLEAERDEWRRAYHQQRGDSQARVDVAALRVLMVEEERDEWRRIASAYSPAKELAESLKQSKASSAALRKERDELRARLAEIEAQEPAMYVLRSASCRPQPSVVTHRRYLSVEISDLVDMGLDHLDPLYARPVPAIPADPGMLTVSMAPSSAYASGWNDCRAKMITAAIAEARREGAEAMREAVESLREDADEIFPPTGRGRQAPVEARDVVEWYSESIRALPLPTGKRQAVRLTDDDVWKSDAIMGANSAAGLQMSILMRLVRAIEAAVLAANGLVTAGNALRREGEER